VDGRSSTGGLSTLCADIRLENLGSEAFDQEQRARQDAVNRKRSEAAKEQVRGTLSGSPRALDAALPRSMAIIKGH
jgi:hypothetical protein